MIANTRRTTVTAALAVLALACAPALAGGGAVATPQPTKAAAEVSIVHGIPGAQVKVCVDGSPVVDDFRFGSKVVGASLSAGWHRVRVVAAGKPCGSAAVLKHRYRLEAGRDYTVVAALKPSGSPALRAFANNMRPTAQGTARLTVRHTAQAPAVNVWASGAKLIGGTRFSWGDSRRFAVPAKAYRVKVTLPGSREPVIGPTRVMLRPGKAYQVYAIGSAGHYGLVVVKNRVGTR